MDELMGLHNRRSQVKDVIEKKLKQQWKDFNMAHGAKKLVMTLVDGILPYHRETSKQSCALAASSSNYHA